MFVCLSRNQVTEAPSTRIRIHSSTQDRILYEYWQQSMRRKVREMCIKALTFTVKNWA